MMFHLLDGVQLLNKTGFLPGFRPAVAFRPSGCLSLRRAGSNSVITSADSKLLCFLVLPRKFAQAFALLLWYPVCGIPFGANWFEIVEPNRTLI
jgi:hypothetical protein